MTPDMHGYDISMWNDVTDEAAVPRYDLVSTKATEGRTFNDPTFDTKWAMFNRSGARYRGAYHWIRSDSPIVAQVNNFIKALTRVGAYRNGKLDQGVMIQLDWETTPNIPDVTVAQVEEWIKLVEGYVGEGRIIVYCSDWVPGFIVWRVRHQQFPVWYANYNLGDTSFGGRAECAKFDAAIWQWTSTFRVPGLSGGIDGNAILKRDVVEALCAYPAAIDVVADHLEVVAPPAPAPTPISPPTPTEQDSDMPFLIVNTTTKQPAIIAFGKLSGLTDEDLPGYIARFGAPIPTHNEVFNDLARKYA